MRRPGNAAVVEGAAEAKFIANRARGKAGEAVTRARLADEGKLAGEQVTFATSTGQQARPDFVVRAGNGFGVVETKTGGAQLSSGQKQLFDDIKEGRPVTPIGKNVEGTGLQVGKPVKLVSCSVDRPC